MEEKKCCTCKQSKLLSEFAWNKSSTDGKSHDCKECHRKTRKTNYSKDPSKWIKQSSRRKKELARKVYEILANSFCVDCGEKDAVVLEFDHISDKNETIIRMVRRGFGWDRIKDEIDKCEIRCCNCHRRKTAKDGAFFSWRFANGQT